jgi:hypothetical protein
MPFNNEFKVNDMVFQVRKGSSAEFLVPSQYLCFVVHNQYMRVIIHILACISYVCKYILKKGKKKFTYVHVFVSISISVWKDHIPYIFRPRKLNQKYCENGNVHNGPLSVKWSY